MVSREREPLSPGDFLERLFKTRTEGDVDTLESHEDFALALLEDPRLAQWVEERRFWVRLRGLDELLGAGLISPSQHKQLLRRW